MFSKAMNFYIYRYSVLLIACFTLILSGLVYALLSWQLFSEEQSKRMLAFHTTEEKIWRMRYEASAKDYKSILQFLRIEFIKVTNQRPPKNYFLPSIRGKNDVFPSLHTDVVWLLKALAKKSKTTLATPPIFIINEMLTMPGIYDLNPHWLNALYAMEPETLIAHCSINRTIAVGITTNYQDFDNFRITIDNFVSHSTNKERRNIVIIVNVCETSEFLLQEVLRNIQFVYGKHIDDGLMQIISAKAEYYPQRMNNYAKQTLDYVYIMLYVMTQTNLQFYMQLQGSMTFRDDFITFIMTKFEELKDDSWLLADYCIVPFMGKLMRTTIFPRLITFFQLFPELKPGSDLLWDYASVKHCSKDNIFGDNCQNDLLKYWIGYDVSMMLPFEA